MTAPTQPPDPQLVTQLARAIQTSTSSGFAGGAMIAEAIDALITERLRVLVEELGGREANVAATEIDPRIVGWMDVCKTLDDVDPTWSTRYNSTDAAIMTIRHLSESLNACRAQQRENVETIQALRERVATAEAANTELDNARKSAEQSARDLRDNNTTLRAELDAIKGAQPRFGSFRDGILSIHGTFKNDDRFDIYRHPAPAQPVVGACVVRKDGRVIEWSSTYEDADGAARNALHYVRSTGDGTAHQLLLGAPLPTEGGK